MFALWTAALAVAQVTLPMGTLVIDAKVPTEFTVDGHKVAELLWAGEFRVQVTSGERKVRAWVAGNVRDLTVDIPPEGVAVVVVGRTGLSAGDAAPVGDVGPVAVEIRVVGSEPVTIRLDDQKMTVDAGESRKLTLAAGRHSLSVRNASGTVVWATGEIQVDGTSPIVLQLTEGRAPEVSGTGAFYASGT